MKTDLNEKYDQDALETLWERVLGVRYRELSPMQQVQVRAMVGCTEVASCPMAGAYNIDAPIDLFAKTAAWHGLHRMHARDVLSWYGVTREDFEAFLAWHDAPMQDHTGLRAWLVEQQAFVQRLRNINSDMDEKNFQRWVKAAYEEHQQEEATHVAQP